MAVNLTIAGVVFPFPTEGEEGWGTVVTNWATAVSTQLLQRTGGSFSLTGEVDFGATFATKQAYLKSRTTPLSTTGFIRMARADVVSWRNQGDSANLPLGVDTSNRLTFDGNIIITDSGGVVPVTKGGTGIASYTTGDMLYASASTTLSKLGIGAANYVNTSTGTAPQWALLVNANIDAAAAIAYSKLNLTGSIVNADVNASAAIVYSKLALTGGIVNADINASAAIARSKIATGTNYRILANTSGGAMGENAALTATHVVYADANGQLAGEATLAVARGGTNIGSYSVGDLIYASASGVLNKLPIGSTGQRLGVSAGIPAWGPASGTLAVDSKTTTFTADPTIDVYNCSSAGGAYTITIPAAGTNTGKVWQFVKTTSDVAAISFGTGITSSINTQGESLTIFDNGVSIEILDRYIPSVWISFTPSGSFINGNVAATGRWRREGDSMRIRTAFALTGAPAAFALTATIPLSLTADTAKIPNTTASVQVVGTAQAVEGGVGVNPGAARYNDSTTFTFISAGAGAWSNTAPFTWGNTDFFSCDILVPISGWNG